MHLQNLTRVKKKQIFNKNSRTLDKTEKPQIKRKKTAVATLCCIESKLICCFRFINYHY